MSLSSRYTMEVPLGESDLGSVWSGKANADGSRVVILQLEDDAPEDVRARFTDHAARLAKLSHPALVKAIEAGGGEEPFLVVERVEGETLAQRMTAGPALRVDRVIELGMQLAEGLAAVHAAGFAHGDVEPGNVFLTQTAGKDGVKLIGFALNRASRRGRAAEERLSLPSMQTQYAFTAPEEARGEGCATAAGDVYSLAAVLFSALAGRPPHIAPDPAALLEAIAKGKAPALASVKKDLTAFSAILERALSTDPKKRPDATAFARGLKTSLTFGKSALALEIPVGARSPIGAAEPPPKPVGLAMPKPGAKMIPRPGAPKVAPPVASRAVETEGRTTEELDIPSLPPAKPPPPPSVTRGDDEERTTEEIELQSLPPAKPPPPPRAAEVAERTTEEIDAPPAPPPPPPPRAEAKPETKEVDVDVDLGDTDDAPAAPVPAAEASAAEPAPEKSEAEPDRAAEKSDAKANDAPKADGDEPKADADAPKADDTTDAKPEAEVAKAEAPDAKAENDAPKAEPAKAEPAKAEPTTETTKTEPTSEPTSEPAKAEPAKAEPAKAEPAKAEKEAPKPSIAAKSNADEARPKKTSERPRATTPSERPKARTSEPPLGLDAPEAARPALTTTRLVQIGLGLAVVAFAIGGLVSVMSGGDEPAERPPGGEERSPASTTEPADPEAAREPAALPTEEATAGEPPADPTAEVVEEPVAEEPVAEVVEEAPEPPPVAAPSTATPRATPGTPSATRPRTAGASSSGGSSGGTRRPRTPPTTTTRERPTVVVADPGF